MNEQQRTALQKSLIVRQCRTRLKKDIKNGTKLAEDIILNPPFYLKNMTLYDFLMWVPSYGILKRNKLMARCHISDRKLMFDLTDQQRNTIMDWMFKNKVKHKS